MAARIRSIEYFYVTVKDQPGEACRLLAQLASADVNLLAFAAIPLGSDHTQLWIFPENVAGLARAAEKGGFEITGPRPAFLILARRYNRMRHRKRVASMTREEIVRLTALSSCAG